DRLINASSCDRRRPHDFVASLFFFQAEDGIRDFHVTGVQTCALPISPEEINLPNTTWQQKIAALRGRVMKRLVDEVTTAFARHQQEILMGQLQGSLLGYCSADIEIGINRAKELARDKIFEHPQKAGLEIIAHQSLQTILDAFIPLTTPHKTLSFKEQRLMAILKRSGAQFSADHYDNIM